MVKKVIMMFLCIMLCFAFSTIAYAAESESAAEQDTNTRYIGAKSHKEIISADDSIMQVTSILYAKSVDSLDYVKVKVELKRETTGTIVKTWDNTLYYNTVIRGFKFSGSHGVSIHDGYYAVTTYKCYKNSKLIETVNGTSKTVYY